MRKKMPEAIKKTDFIKNVFKKYPIIRDAFIDKNMHCVGCEIYKFATIAESCNNHNVGDVDEFVEFLNDIKHKQK